MVPGWAAATRQGSSKIATSADVGDDRGQAWEQRRPADVGRGRDEHLASAQLAAALDAAEYPHRTLRDAGRARHPTIVALAGRTAGLVVHVAAPVWIGRPPLRVGSPRMKVGYGGSRR